jgi:hypothetical protein
MARWWAVTIDRRKDLSRLPIAAAFLLLVDRAATCGVVAAAEARAATPDIKAPLPLPAQGRILHYALLAGAEGGEYSQEKANAVTNRMSALQEEITEGKWKALAPECRTAFPLAEAKEVTLPDDRFDAQLACDELGDFLSTALGSQETDYGKELGEYDELRRKLNQRLGPGLRARAGSGLEAQQKARRAARAAASGYGSPVAVLRECVKRYG